MNKRLLYVLIAVSMLTSCAENYSVQGTSSIAALDGSKLYLKAIKSGELKNIDSCDVVHGQFHFNGLLDTVRMTTLFMDDEGIMPVVLEKGDISIRIDNASRRVSGTPLNEELYEFLNRHDQLDNEMSELTHRHSQMLLEGEDEDVINEKLSLEAARIAQQEDSLVTNFIIENFDNVLGPGVFMMITNSYPYPVLTPQIEDIMSKATAKFKNDPYVKEYYQTANEIQARENGLVDDGTLPPPPAQGQQPLPAQQPLPNDSTITAE
jgi:hypothetical protein